jgi:hypothetical protein
MTHTHSARSACRDPTIEPNRPSPVRPTTSEAGPRDTAPREHSTYGRLDDGNLIGDDTQAQRKGGFEGESSERWGPADSGNDVVTGGRLSHAQRWAEAL